SFYHAEDCTRADWNYEMKIIQGVIDTGAECYRICDTVGAALSAHVSDLVPIERSVPDRVKKINELFGSKIEIEFHGHDDLGNAVTNTMTALNNGATWASTTMLGIGERSGNAETEKVIMNLYYHYKVEKYKIERLTECCEKISKFCDITIPNNKAIVGPNVFTHQSGIHSDGVIKHPETYELYPPEIVGNVRKLFIGSYSGKNVILHKLRELMKQEKSLATLDENDGRVKALVDYIQNNLFGSGVRHSPLTDSEFKMIARMFALI
ncbi:MAG: LeuA family protein, partial [Candidatus Helarchaeales archaeon]